MAIVSLRPFANLLGKLVCDIQKPILSLEIPLQTGGPKKLDMNLWQAYCEANQAFADAVRGLYYHLCLETQLTFS